MTIKNGALPFLIRGQTLHLALFTNFHLPTEGRILHTKLPSAEPTRQIEEIPILIILTNIFPSIISLS